MTPGTLVVIRNPDEHSPWVLYELEENENGIVSPGAKMGRVYDGDLAIIFGENRPYLYTMSNLVMRRVICRLGLVWLRESMLHKIT